MRRRGGRFAAAKILVENGVDVNIKDGDDHVTALILPRAPTGTIGSPNCSAKAPPSGKIFAPSTLRAASISAPPIAWTENFVDNKKLKVYIFPIHG
ncbi:MAG TPA: hypothetical protein VIL74_02065 [Pyrinomonadaceae bacterium]